MVWCTAGIESLWVFPTNICALLLKLLHNCHSSYNTELENDYFHPALHLTRTSMFGLLLQA